MTPRSVFSLACAKTAKRFLPNASMIMMMILYPLRFWHKNQRYHLQRGHGVPSKLEGGCGGGGSLRHSLYFSMGKAHNEVFHVSVSKNLQNAIYFDESHA